MSSSKEIKSLLKEIRENLKAENHQEAITKCEELLKMEPTSYMGHILMGAAYQNSNKTKAALYLRKAVDFSSPQPPIVALQGLANCAPIEDLPKIYVQLIVFVPEKQLDYYEKLYNVSLNANVASECFEIFKRLIKKTQDEQHRLILLQYFGRILIQKEFKLEDEDEDLHKSCLEAIIKDENIDVHLAASKRYLKLLYKQKNLRTCLDYACQMVEQYPRDVYAYEWICIIYCEQYENAHDNCLKSLKEPIDTYAAQLAVLNPQSSLAFLIRAIRHYQAEQYVAARELLVKAQAIQPSYVIILKLLALTHMHLEAYSLALTLWQQVNDSSNTDYAICISYSGDLENIAEAVTVLKEVEEPSEEIVRALARCYFKLGDARSLNNLKMSDLCKAEFMYYDSQIEAISFLGTSWEDLETFPALLLRGRLYCELHDYNTALNCILKATRFKPHSSECFYFLGQIYLATSDIARARKCFEKCVHLNPLNEDAVEKLSAIYQELNEEDLNVALLLNTLKSIKRPSSLKHIQYKLGLHYLRVKNCDEAIQCFRAAIKTDISCMMYWESLGDAYAERGSYNSAIKVFQKVLEIQPDNVYAQLQIALMKTTVRMYSEAIEDFNNLLKQNEDYLPALKGAAEAHIGLANYLRQEYRYGRAKDHFQMAINMLQRCFLNPENLNMVWLWRLCANVFTSTAQMPESLANLDVSGKLAKRDTDIAFLTRSDLLNLAIRFYTCALKIKQNTYLWYELALSCYYCASYLAEEAKTHLDMAIRACQMAIKEDQTRWHNWNLLGVINMHEAINNLPMAQHCFVQALNCDRKSYTSWTNLGVLYLNLGEIKMANQAFQRAQQSSPIYGNAWLGQAMIAEYIQEEEEAIDLFRHCQQFEYHPESSLGYAHWVCNILSNEEKRKSRTYIHAIESGYADVIAYDAINWYCIKEETDTPTSAWSFLGFLSERHNHYRQAARAYAKAAEKCIGEDRDRMYTNLGYVHLKLNEPNEAIMAFNKIAHASFKPLIGLALAYYKAGQHQESYSVYNSVLKSVAGIEDDKASRILVAMASMVYAFQGEADTKTILYQCILLKDSPIQALYSACALGILHRDNQLSETILSELKKYESSQEYSADIAYLKSQYYVVNNQVRKALTYLMTRVHIFPNSAQLRKVLANFLLNNYSNKLQYQNATSQIALSAITLVHSNKTKKNDAVEDSETLLIASKSLQPVDAKRSLKLTQRAILLYPKNVNAWSALLEVH